MERIFFVLFQSKTWKERNIRTYVSFTSITLPFFFSRIATLEKCDTIDDIIRCSVGVCTYVGSLSGLKLTLNISNWRGTWALACGSPRLGQAPQETLGRPLQNPGREGEVRARVRITLPSPQEGALGLDLPWVCRGTGRLTGALTEAWLCRRCD